MTVSCPECRSVFRVDPAKVPATGVRARCSVCGGVIAISGGTLPISVTPSSLGAVNASRLTPARPFAAASAAAGAAPAPMAGTPSAVAVVAPLADAPTRAASSAPPATEPKAVAPTANPASVAAAAAAPAPSSGFVNTLSMPPAVAPARADVADAVVSAAPPVTPAPSAALPLAEPPRTPSLTPPPPARLPSMTPRSTPPFVPISPMGGAPTPARGVAAVAQTTASATPRRSVNPFLNADPGQRARRLARALVSDLVAYHPQKREEGLRDGTLRQLFREDIKKSYEEYVEQVGRDTAESSPHFQDALNEILGGGRKLF
ncbi:MAG: zinc-ribbon domain-containing protein [Gemmatimonadaceae bacterium]|nr:zinc-ribbon domain-containing protein [Gemmatimonadaceae bacterium]